jgi:hypothetical protein
MSPIDDELRHALHHKSATLAPPVDVFTAVERRAHHIRRRRVAVSVTGSALAVAVIAVAIPQFVPSHQHRGTATAPVVPTPVASYALDASSPWAYRGDQTVVADGNLDAFRQLWATKHPSSQLEPLFGQLEPSSQVPELVFVGKVGTGARWGIVAAAASGPVLLLDNPLAPNSRMLTTVLSGDGVERLLVVAAPAIGSITYTAKDGTLQTTTKLAPGVATVDVHAGDATGSVNAVAAGGQVIASETVPTTPVAIPQPNPAPGNVLGWPVRGTMPPNLLAAAQAAYLSSRSGVTTEPTMRPLYGGTDAAGSQYLLAQAWQPGDSVADTVGFVKHPDGTTELQLNARATKDTKVLVLDVVDSPAGATETLVVVPQPAFGQALYAADGSHFMPVASSQDGVVVISRDPKSSNDKLRLLDGDGRTFFDGAMLTLLCGVSGCG